MSLENRTFANIDGIYAPHRTENYIRVEIELAKIISNLVFAVVSTHCSQESSNDFFQSINTNTPTKKVVEKLWGMHFEGSPYYSFYRSGFGIFRGHLSNIMLYTLPLELLSSGSNLQIQQSQTTMPKKITARIVLYLEYKVL